jgi:outer membrane protein assembly factor BamB
LGGSVWSSVGAYRGKIFATTGNPRFAFGESIVRLTVDLVREESFQVPAPDETPDADFGGSPTIFGANLGGSPTTLVGACNKNGRFYALKAFDFSGGPVWKRTIGTPYGQGGGECIAAAIWTGGALFVAGNQTTISGVTHEGSLRRLDPATGTPIWETPLEGAVLGTPTMNGVGVIAVGTFDSTNALYLIRASTGEILHTIPSPQNKGIWSQPVMADGFVFMGLDGGSLRAYSPTA